MLSPDSILQSPAVVNTGIEVVKNICLAVTSLVTLASLITASTPTPNRFSFFHEVYRAIEFCALVVGKAKNRD